MKRRDPNKLYAVPLRWKGSDVDALDRAVVAENAKHHGGAAGGHGSRFSRNKLLLRLFLEYDGKSL